MTESEPRDARGTIPRWFARRPRWVRVVLGTAALVLGAVVLVRPTTSLGVLALLIGAGVILTGVLELTGGGDAGRAPRWRVAIAALWIGAGIFILTWPGLTVRVLALVVAVGLLANGVFSVVSAFSRRASVDARIASGLLGIAGVVFGLLALLWPDITLLIVAAVFGARLIIGGALEIWQTLRGRTRRAPRAPRRWVRTTAAVVAVLLAGGAASLSATLRAGSPVVDEFYAAPRTVPPDPGELIRAESFTRKVPTGALAWRILYTTTDGDGAPAVASGLVVVPAAGEGDWPVVDWAHGTTGFAQQCAPSLLPEPFESGAFFLLDDVVARGWALVATDYIGLGTPGPHPYLVGEPSGRAVLDAVSAARDLDEARLGAQTVVWGHSQGGAAALWAGVLAARGYAPEVPLDGVAALAPAADLPGMVGEFDRITGGSVFASFVIAAYAQLYDDVAYGRYVRPGAEVAVRQMAGRCLAEPSTGVSVLALLGMRRDPDIFAADPTTDPLGARLRENIPPASIAAPLLIGQGADDELISRAVQDGYVGGLCAAGQRVDYRLYPGRGHVPLVEPGSPLVPDLFAWTAARFAGEPAEPGCRTTER
ncbi:lipase family protein [Microbacterium rhizophilus]|uniref:lipase family protein n=1 Tax=Microbacterium rhizophilus TaxID=3138934 RepID=UPI0031E638B8